jgi:hypothetical protein
LKRSNRSIFSVSSNTAAYSTNLNNRRGISRRRRGRRGRMVLISSQLKMIVGFLTSSFTGVPVDLILIYTSNLVPIYRQDLFSSNPTPFLPPSTPGARS